MFLQDLDSKVLMMRLFYAIILLPQTNLEKIMVAITLNTHISTPRVKKYRDNMLKQGFKRVQKWVFDLDNSSIKKQLKQDLKNYHRTQEMKEWDDLAAEQFANLKD
ncbi:MAG: hypothetical protein K0R14_1015 [Burkholderiales bacterium]|jgi:hypothetical protein|nr:hypothetical protein [Burkholderiales bacterium]